MHRRTYLTSVTGVVTASVIGGCLQGEPVLHKTQISATAPTTEWEVELQEGNQMRLEVAKTNDSPGSIYGYVSIAETSEEIVATSADNSDETFTVPTTATYLVSVDADGATGEIILRDLD